MVFDLALIVAGAFLAALVIGSAGFAFAMIVTGIWIYVLPPASLVLLSAICATLLHATNVWQFRRDIEFGLLWPFLVGAVAGVPLGVLALQHVDTTLFREVFGVLMIVYSTFMLIRPRLPAVELGPLAARLCDGAVGWVSGMLGGLAMLHGVLTTIWCGLRGWDKRRARCVYQPYIGFTALLVMFTLGVNFEGDAAQLGLYLLVCLPALAAGMWLGLRIFNWISEEHFRKLVLWMILFSGVSLLL